MLFLFCIIQSFSDRPVFRWSFYVSISKNVESE